MSSKPAACRELAASHWKPPVIERRMHAPLTSFENQHGIEFTQMPVAQDPGSRERRATRRERGSAPVPDWRQRWAPAETCSKHNKAVSSCALPAEAYIHNLQRLTITGRPVKAFGTAQI